MGFYINEVFYEKFWPQILIGFNIHEVFMWGFGHTKLYSNGIQY